ncbi:hypothetical protein OF117_21015 [Geodermatophilus sp. YIM 151500]|uniref:hypothetical protein n=1 Tax=Geodermatophilus sp. YIM 151500 TaxID=2984531 RepID=UPI0021E41D60|nr:hypothetical protein [Geodermatophilus sp. YIM 151500]MCV2491833.1 hypothetical protein [Geodermatophilus sp. YIM 151500]
MPDGSALGPRAERPAAGQRARGLGRVLIALYGVFALAAGARAAVQLSTRFEQAPLAYLLSALAAAVYLVATVALARGGRGGLRTAAAAILFELAGVLGIGTLSLARPDAFPDETVWSQYGSGYLFVPLALPLIGLVWLRARTRAERPPGGAAAGPSGRRAK